MKILLLNSEYPPVGGGAGNASANLARLLAKDNEIILLTSRFDDFPRDEICDGVRIIRVSSLRKKMDRSGAVEQISFIFAASFRTLSLVCQFKPDVTLAFFGLPSGAVAWMIKKIFGVLYIVSLRGGDVPGFRPYDFKLYHKIAAPFLHVIWRAASSVIANSKGLHALAAAFDSTIEIPIIPNGVDLEKFSVPSRDWSMPHLLSVGRLVYQKGLDLAMHALADLKDLPWTWTIAGDGPQMETLQSMAKEFEIADRIHFIGWQSTAQLKEQYHIANIFLFPSRHEGMPNAVLEAMASGLPVVATKIAGNEELVVNGETGALVPAEDVESLRESLRPLLVDAKMREKMGHASRQRVEESFSWNRVAERYQRILEEVAK